MTPGASRAVLLLSALLLSALLLGAGGVLAGTADARTSQHATAPLTGRRVAASVARRPAVAVKIENTPDARPQSGLADADIVYEQVLEGGVTRFIAVFQSRVPAWAGPVRSVREMDPAIVAPLRGVVAFSGGTEANVALLREAPVTLVDEASGGTAFARIGTRSVPHNLYVRVGRLQDAASGAGPQPLFDFAPHAGARERAPLARVRLTFAAGYDVTYRWEPHREEWVRSQGGRPFRSETGSVIGVDNVVVQLVRYGAGGDGALVGAGEAVVLTGERMVHATWTKHAAGEPTTYTDATGAPVGLAPGRTWVELLPDTASVNARTKSRDGTPTLNPDA